MGGPEAEGHHHEPIHSNQAKLTSLTKDINVLCQQVEARERQAEESLDHLEWKLQNLSLALQPLTSPTPAKQPEESLDHVKWELQNLSLVLQPLMSPTPTKAFGEVMHQDTNTLCTTQK